MGGLGLGLGLGLLAGTTVPAVINITLPSIAGTAAQGSTLTVTPGTWNATPAPTLTHQWLRNGAVIPGQTNLTYTLAATDYGTMITCQEKATNSQGSAAAVSNALGPITQVMILDLDFRSGRYVLNGTTYATPGAIPGWAYSGGPGTAEDNRGAVTNFAVNVPRITNQGFLMEEAATNLVVQSQDVTQAVWTKGAAGVALAPVITPNYTFSPTGSNAAQRVQFDLNGGVTGSDYTIVQQAMTRPAETDIISFYLKSNTTDSYILRISLNVAARVVALVRVTPVWRRFTLSGAADTSASGGGLAFYLQGATGTSPKADILFWGAQLEVQQPGQTGPTSYIYTTTATVTRPKDSHSITTGGLLPTGNMMVIAGVLAPFATSPGGVFCSFNDGNIGNNAVDLSINAPAFGNASTSVYVAAANVLTFTSNTSGQQAGQSIIGITASGAAASFSPMGQAPQSSSAYAAPTGVVAQRFGGFGGSLNLDGYIQTLQNSAYASTAANLQARTLPPVPVNTVLPVACGPAPLVAGAVLYADPGFWTNAPTSFNYQWKNHGVSIVGAGAQTYTVKAADLPAAIQVQMSANNAAGVSGAVVSSNALS